MFRAIDDFLRVWQQQSAATAGILDALTDSALAQRASPGHWSLAQIAWHLVRTLQWMMGRTGLAVAGPSADTPVPTGAAAIAEGYRQAARALAEAVQTGWMDETLLIEDDMYGETWPRGFTLLALLIHQAHHRGQMTPLMRQAGLDFPGTCGPSREEWAQWGMEPLEV